MKRLIMALIGIWLFVPVSAYSQTNEYVVRPVYPDIRQRPGEAGSYSNPYTVRERWDGNLEVRPKYIDPRQQFLSPGSYSNPYIIEQR
jgi:hypothetical protein